MNKYYKFEASTPYSGTTTEHFVKFENEPSKNELDEMALEYAQENAASYEYLVFGWGYDPEEDEDMTMEDYEETIDCYYADCYCEYEEITEAEYLAGIGI